MFLGLFQCVESPEIPSPARLRIAFSRIQTINARLKFSNHDTSPVAISMLALQSLGGLCPFFAKCCPRLFRQMFERLLALRSCSCLLNVSFRGRPLLHSRHSLTPRSCFIGLVTNRFHVEEQIPSKVSGIKPDRCRSEDAWGIFGHPRFASVVFIYWTMPGLWVSVDNGK